MDVAGVMTPWTFFLYFLAAAGGVLTIGLSFVALWLVLLKIKGAITR